MPLNSDLKLVNRGEILPSSRSGVHTVLLERSSGGISTSLGGAKRVEYPLKKKPGRFWKWNKYLKEKSMQTHVQ
jgi:hypothetical protein